MLKKNICINTINKLNKVNYPQIDTNNLKNNLNFINNFDYLHNKIKIFITWKTNNLTKKENENLNLWIKHNDKLDIIFFDDYNIDKWMKNYTEFYPFPLYDIFKSLNSNAGKIDLWRYCILYIEGGLYCDFDLLSLKKLNFLHDEYLLVIPNDHFGFFQGFIYSPNKKNIILKECIDGIVNNYKNNLFKSSIIKENILAFSGPTLFENVLDKYKVNKKSGIYKTEIGKILIIDHNLGKNSDFISYNNIPIIKCQIYWKPSTNWIKDYNKDLYENIFDKNIKKKFFNNKYNNNGISKIFYQSWEHELPENIKNNNNNYIPKNFDYKLYNLFQAREYLVDNCKNNCNFSLSRTTAYFAVTI